LERCNAAAAAAADAAALPNNTLVDYPVIDDETNHPCLRAERLQVRSREI
jgi:hypothetical protein